MPDVVSLRAIETWKESFGRTLESVPFVQMPIMLVDVNGHEFESIECLKSLREFFTTNAVIRSKGVKVAFVTPATFTPPHIKSEVEAYFESFEEAYKWLKGP